MMSMRSQRGAALPETALSLTLMLAVLVGGLRLAIVGYEQVAVDGAAFYNSHEQSLKDTYPAVAASLDATAATQDAYPRSNQATVAIAPTSPLPAPTVGVPTQYGLSNTNNRHGGTSLVQPLQQMTVVQNSSIDSLSPWGGSLLSVTGYGIDVAYLETGSHYSVNGDDFNTGNSTTDAVDYFSQGENVPPYFVGLSYMSYCPTPDSLTSHWDGCNFISGVSYRALGLAEFLDTSNWSRASPGETPAGDGGPVLGGVFWETVFHHDVYARLSQALPGDISTPGNLHLAQEVLDWNGAGAEAMYGTLCSSTIGAPCNGDIIKVYGWDAIHIAGGVPMGYVFNSNPLTPGNGYPAQ